jgi:short-subunit dehydrogenase involved in D-alanine esterification of teichoic acids
VVNNAGYDLMGALKETSIDEIKAQFETNFFGAVRVIQAVIPIMRKQRGGIIVNITSLGGRISFPLNSPYQLANNERHHLFCKSESFLFPDDPQRISSTGEGKTCRTASLIKLVKR